MRNLKNRWADFHKNLKCSCAPHILFLNWVAKFKTMAILEFTRQHVLGEVKAMIQNSFLSSLYISVAIKASLLKFNMLNIYKNNIFKMFIFFSKFKIVDLI